MLSRFRLLLGALSVALTLALGAGCADTTAEDVGASEGAATDTAPASNAAEALEAAIAKKEAIDARLGRVMSRVGSMLTSDELRAVVAAFNKQPDVVAIETDYHARAAALATELDKIAADPMAVEDYGARRLFDGYALLAKTPAARSALNFAAMVLSKRLVLDVSDGDVVEKVLGPSLAPAFLSALLEKGDKATAVLGLRNILQRGGSTCVTIAGWLQKYDALDGHDILAQNLALSSQTAIQSLRTIAGILAIWEIGLDLVDGDVQAALQQFLESGPNAISGLAEATSLFRRVFLGFETTPLADAIVRWSGKVAQGIGLVMAAIDLWNDAGKWNDSLEAKIRVAGDLLALGASILVLAGAGPIGPILASVALGIGWFADWLEDRRLAEQERADLTACLPATGLAPALVTTILESSPAIVGILVQDVKMSPSLIQWLFTIDPVLANDQAALGLRFIGLRVAQRIFELDPTETDALLHAAVGAESDPAKAAYKLDMFLRGLEFGSGFNGDLPKAEALAWLATEADSPFVREGEQKDLRRAAFLAARDYLAGL